MRLIKRVRLLVKRIYVISSAFLSIKSLKAAYLLSKYPQNYSRKLLDDIKWVDNGFLVKQNNFQLNSNSVARVSADFRLLKRMMEIGDFKYIEGELAFQVKIVDPYIQVVIENWDILMLIEDLFIKGEYNIFNYSGSSLLVVDVGMNVAVASLYFASYKNVYKVYGFEPLQVNYNAALKNLALNTALKGKVRANNFGLASSEKEIEIEFTNTGDVGFSTTDFVRNRKSKINNSSKKKVLVKLKKASDVIRKIINENPNKQIFLKLDCEGAEYEIIDQLAKENLLKKIFLVHIEWHYNGPVLLKNILIKNNFEILEDEKKKINNYTGLIKALNRGE